MIEREILLDELQLPDTVIEVGNGIEKSFGRPVRYVVVDRLLIPAEGEAGVYDGIPTVRLTQAGCRPDNILHELLHLECEAQGFPRSGTIASADRLTKEDVQDLVSHWHSMLEHRVIYDRMKVIGFDPHIDLDRKIEATMETLFNPIILAQRTKTTAYRRVIMVTMIARCLLEATPKMAQRVAEYAIAQGFKIEVARAKAIIEWVEKTGKSPNDIRVALLKCLGELGIPSKSIRFEQVNSR